MILKHNEPLPQKIQHATFPQFRSLRLGSNKKAVDLQSETQTPYLNDSVSTISRLFRAQGFGYFLSVGHEGAMGQTCRHRCFLDLKNRHTRFKYVYFKCRHWLQKLWNTDLQQRWRVAEMLRLDHYAGFQVVLSGGWFKHFNGQKQTQLILVRHPGTWTHNLNSEHFIYMFTLYLLVNTNQKEDGFVFACASMYTCVCSRTVFMNHRMDFKENP